jgi:predicted short-subunit dehydrogenase-like oxidoreductase (DUF2520 family)
VAAARKLLVSAARGRTRADPEEALAATEAVLVCVPDDAIVPLALRLARSIPAGRSKLPPVLHTNGYLGVGALSALRKNGVAVGTLHPFAAIRRPMPLSGLSYGIAGDPRALRVARALVRQLRGQPIHLRATASPDYHAAASLISGGFVALFELADRVLSRAVRGEKARHAALHGLVNVTDINVRLLCARGALTGALARGSESTVRGHLRALRRSPQALAAYRVLGRTMLELARARGSIDAAAMRRLGKLLDRDGR